MRFELGHPTQTDWSIPNSVVPLILLVGLPGSGKSSLAASLVRECPLYRLISTDTIRLHLFGDEAIQGPWLKVWRTVSSQFQQTAHQIATGHISAAIYDATNAVRRERRRVIALAHAQGFTDITVLWVNTALAVCLQRNQERDRQVPETVILRMHRCLMGAPPSVSEGCDRVFVLY